MMIKCSGFVFFGLTICLIAVTDLNVHLISRIARGGCLVGSFDFLCATVFFSIV